MAALMTDSDHCSVIVTFGV